MDHKLTGKVIGDIVDAKRKQEILLTLMQSHSLVKDQVIAVGKFILFIFYIFTNICKR